jgi:hypothetical protein
MAAEITLFRQSATKQQAQVPAFPVASYTATFTPTVSGVIRVYANAAAVALTIGGITFNVPSGTVEYFGVEANKAVTVA